MAEDAGGDIQFIDEVRPIVCPQMLLGKVDEHPVALMRRDALDIPDRRRTDEVHAVRRVDGRRGRAVGQHAELRDADRIIRGDIDLQPAPLEILDGGAVLLELLGDRLAEDRLLGVPDAEEAVRRPVPPRREVERVRRRGAGGLRDRLEGGHVQERAELRRLAPDDREFRRVAPLLHDAPVFVPLLLPPGGRLHLIERPAEAVRAAGLLPQGAEGRGDDMARRAGIEGRYAAPVATMVESSETSMRQPMSGRTMRWYRDPFMPLLLSPLDRAKVRTNAIRVRTGLAVYRTVMRQKRVAIRP